MTKRKAGLSWDEVRRLAHTFPDVVDSTSYGTAALKRKKTLLVRLKEDGETIAVKCDLLQRDTLLEMEPETFFLTDHYRDYPWILVRLAKVKEAQLRSLMEEAWAMAGGKRSTTA